MASSIPVDARRPSQIPLQELEPSPVDETPASQPDEKSSYFPSTASHPSPNRPSTTFLGLHPHTLTTILQALQKYSTIPPTIYLAMHYTNTALIPLFTRSLPTSDKTLLLTRPYYQSYPLEPLLIFAPIATHVLSGITLRLHRRFVLARRHGAETHSQRKSIPWPKLSLTSALGYALYPMLAAHVYVNRILPLNHSGDSSGVGLRYFAYGMRRHPLPLNVAYAAMLGVASVHFVTGAAKFLRWSAEYVVAGGEDGRRERRRRTWLVNGTAAVVWAVWVAGGLGVVGMGVGGIQAGAWETRGWDELYRKVPLIGQWL